MNSLTNGTHVAECRRGQRVLRLPGPDGPRIHAREIAHFSVSKQPARSPRCSLWRGRFVAGDCLTILARHPAGGPLEVVVFDAAGAALERKKSPAGSCHLSLRLRQSGDYAVRVEDLSGAHASLPFELTVERWLPGRCRRAAPGPTFAELARRLLQRLRRRSGRGWALPRVSRGPAVA